MAEKEITCDIEDKLYGAKCKIAFIRGMFLNVDQEDFDLGSNDAWVGLEMILGEVLAVIDPFTGPWSSGSGEKPKRPRRSKDGEE